MDFSYLYRSFSDLNYYEINGILENTIKLLIDSPFNYEMSAYSSIVNF